MVNLDMGWIGERLERKKKEMVVEDEDAGEETSSWPNCYFFGYFELQDPRYRVSHLLRVRVESWARLKRREER